MIHLSITADAPMELVLVSQAANVHTSLLALMPSSSARPRHPTIGLVSLDNEICQLFCFSSFIITLPHFLLFFVILGANTSWVRSTSARLDSLGLVYNSGLSGLDRDVSDGYSDISAYDIDASNLLPASTVIPILKKQNRQVRKASLLQVALQ